MLGRTIAEGTSLMAFATSCSAKALVKVYVFMWSLRSLKQKYQQCHYKSSNASKQILMQSICAL